MADTPSSISAGLIVQGNLGGTALEFGQALGTTDSPTFGGLAVDTTTDALRLPRMTTTQRDALTPLNGFQIFNTTTVQAEIYNGTSWIAMVSTGVNIIGTPVDNQVGIWVSATGMEGSTGFTFDGTALNLLDNISLTIGTGADFSIIHDGSNTVAVNTTGDFLLDNQDAVGNSVFLLGSNDVNTAFRVDGNTSGAVMTAFGSGEVVVGIGTDPISTSKGTLWVRTSGSIVPATPTDANTLVLEDAAGPGISLISAGGATSRIRFGRTGDVQAANVSWEDTSSLLVLSSDLTAGELQLRSGNSIDALRIDASQGIGIGTTSIDASALVELSSTTRGFLGPRMTTTQRDAISSPATGLEIFNTTTAQPEYYSGTAWVSLEGDNIYTADGLLTGTRSVRGEQGRLLIIESYDLTPGDFTQRGEMIVDDSSSTIGQYTGDGTGDDVAEVSILLDVSAAPVAFKITDTLDNKGAVYAADYSANFTARSLVDKGYVDASNAAAGNDTEVQFNNSGAFGASSLFTYNGLDLSIATTGADIAAFQIKNSGATTKAVYRRDTYRLAESESGSFQSMGQPFIAINFVRYQKHPIRGSLLSQKRCHGLVKSCNSRLRVDHEENERRLFTCGPDLIFDIGRELGQVSPNFVVTSPFNDINAVAPGVDQLDKFLRRPFGSLQRRLDLDNAGYPIPGHAGGGIDD